MLALLVALTLGLAYANGANDVSKGIANLVTSVLVASASTYGLPVSTTHVSTSAIVGISLYGRSVQWRTVRDLLLAWIVTLPAAALLAYLAFGLF